MFPGLVPVGPDRISLAGSFFFFFFVQICVVDECPTSFSVCVDLFEHKMAFSTAIRFQEIQNIIIIIFFSNS